MCRSTEIWREGIFELSSNHPYVDFVEFILVMVLLGEGIAPEQWLTYGVIWLAIVVLIVEGYSTDMGPWSRAIVAKHFGQRAIGKVAVEGDAWRLQNAKAGNVVLHPYGYRSRRDNIGTSVWHRV